MFERRGGEIIPALSLPTRRYKNSVTQFVRLGLRAVVAQERDAKIAEAKALSESRSAFRAERAAIRRRYNAPHNPVYASWLLGELALHIQSDQRDITVTQRGGMAVNLTMKTSAEFTASHQLSWELSDEGYRLSRLVINDCEHPVDKTGPAGDIGYMFDSFNSYGHMYANALPLARVIMLPLRVEHGGNRAQAA